MNEEAIDATRDAISMSVYPVVLTSFSVIYFCLLREEKKIIIMECNEKEVKLSVKE